MKHLRLVRLLLLPSVASFCCSILFAGVVLIGRQWTYIHAQPFFVQYFSGEYGLGALLHQLNLAFGRATDSLLAYNIAVICVSVLVGVGLYALLQGTQHMLAKTHLALEETGYTNQNAHNISKELGRRLGLRSVTALAWLGYTFLFVRLVLPLCTTLTNHAPNTLNPTVWLHYCIALVLLVVAAHIHIIFIRLILLRPRILGIAPSLTDDHNL